MICGRDIGNQSTLNILEIRWGAIFENKRGLAKFLRFFSLLEAARLNDFAFEERQLNGREEGSENYPSYKSYQITPENAENWRKITKLQIVGFMRHFPRSPRSK